MARLANRPSVFVCEGPHGRARLRTPNSGSAGGKVVSDMTPDRREVTGGAVVAGLALTAIAVAGFALATAIAEGFSARAAAGPPDGGEQMATPGRPLFRQFCARCHGIQAQGKGSFPPLANVGLTREEVAIVVREGIPPLMPAFGKRLRAEQIQALADYVASLNREATPDQAIAGDTGPKPGGGQPRASSPSGADQEGVMAGRLVFRLNCARCHGLQAEGRGNGPPLANVGLRREDIAAAVREGIPPFMPAFGNRLRADQIRAVTDYVFSLNQTTPPGEAALPGGGRGFTGGMRCPCPMMRGRN